MKCLLRLIGVLVFLPLSACSAWAAGCQGISGVPFNCPAGSTPAATDLLLGGNVTGAGPVGNTASFTMPQVLGGIGRFAVPGAATPQAQQNLGLVIGTNVAPATSGSAAQLGNGSGGFTPYAGVTCPSHQWLDALSAAIAATCAQIGASDLPPSVTTGWVSVLAFGAICDGITDNSAAFNAALRSVPTGGTVFVPPCGGTIPPNGGGSAAANGNGYVFRSAFVNVTAAHLVGLGNGATIKCEVPNSQFGCVYVTDSGVNNLTNSLTSLENIAIYGATGVGNAVQGVIVQGGNNMVLRNLVITNMTANGVQVESTFNGGWVESLHIDNVRVYHSGVDNFQFLVNGSVSNNFITQTLITNSTSRNPGQYALDLISGSTGSSNSKISDFKWEGGELDGTGGSGADIVELQQLSSNSQSPLEAIEFDNVAIEDGSNAHTGYAIGVTKTGSTAVGPLTVTNGIYYGEASGGAKLANVGSYSIDFCADGTTQCHLKNSVQINAEAGLSFLNQTIHTGANAVTFGNSPCAAGVVQDWLATQINGTTYYVPACHP